VKELFRLNKFFLKYRWLLFSGILFVTASNLFGIFPAQLTRHALDLVASDLEIYSLMDGFNLGGGSDIDLSHTVFLFSLLVLGMALLKGVFMFLMRQSIIVMSRHIEYDMKNEVFDHYQKLGMDFYNRNSTGDLMNRISEDVGRVRMYVGPAIMYTINMLVMFVLVIWAMVSVNGRMALYVLLPLPVLTFLIYLVQHHINRKSEAVQEKLSDLSTFVQESFSGIRLIKSFAGESGVAEKYRDNTAAYGQLSMDLVKVNAMFIPSMLLLVGLSTVFTVYIGGQEVIRGHLSIGNIAEFVIYVNMLTWPVASLGWVITIIQRAAASQQRINAFLNEKPSIVSGTLKPEKLEGHIRFREVTVRYEAGRKPALSGITFDLPAGQSLGIIGRTGSGKTTLVNALLRLVEPDEGEIMIDGHPLTDLDLEAYRRSIGCVPQDVFLFSDTIAGNINFGRPDGVVSSEEMKDAAKAAGVYETISAFPEGFDTWIGERGIMLSGGQKQRISIARAIIRNPRILVLDDCLSAVDTLTEEKIIGNLRRLMKDRTSVLVSHRVSAVRHCDQIIVLEHGRIAAKGTHAELLEQGGWYAWLYQVQGSEEQANIRD